MGKYALSPLGVFAAVGRQRLVARRLLREAQSIGMESAALLAEMRAMQVQFEKRSEEVLATAREVAMLMPRHPAQEAASQKPKDSLHRVGRLAREPGRSSS